MILPTSSFFDMFSTITAEAHCDVPCGIYDPTAAKVAAKTVLRMVMQLKEIAPPKDTDSSDPAAMTHYHNMLVRRIWIKEEQARLCKQELSILWSDFFKPEHLEQYPEIHDLFWKSLKLCSKNKQEADQEAAEKLCELVDRIAEIFYTVKKAPERFEAYKQITDKLF